MYMDWLWDSDTETKHHTQALLFLPEPQLLFTTKIIHQISDC